jgi:hypothetical protein
MSSETFPKEESSNPLLLRRNDQTRVKLVNAVLPSLTLCHFLALSATEQNYS